MSLDDPLTADRRRLWHDFSRLLFWGALHAAVILIVVVMFAVEGPTLGTFVLGIVLYGLHEIANAPAMHEVLLEAVREMPPGGCLVVISRADPVPAFARLRANGQLSVLDWDDIRLTRDGKALLCLRRRACSDACVRSLCRRPEHSR